jgi:hypothetical protein
MQCVHCVCYVCCCVVLWVHKWCVGMCVGVCVIYVFCVCGVYVFVQCVWCAIRSNWWYLLLECVFVCVCDFLCFYNFYTLVALLQYTVLTLLFLSR